MLYKISRLLNFRLDEVSRILPLFLQSLFFGIFISYYNSYINALFLSAFDLSYLSYAYLGSGIIGILTTFVFSVSSKKLKFKTHSIVIYTSISLFILLLKLGIDYSPYTKVFAFLGFILYTPLASFVALVVSGLIMKLFNLRQGKRLYSLIASGSVCAAIISYMTVPLLLSIVPTASDLLWFALGGIVMGMLVQLRINNNYSDVISHNDEQRSKKQVAPKVSIFGTTYFRRIFILSICSMAGLIIVSYSFLSASRIYFSGFDVKTLGQFFGLFFGITKAIEFIMNTFLSGKLLEKYGLRFGLVLLPISLLMFSILAVVISVISFQFDGLETIVFIIIVLSMLDLIVVKRSMEDSSFKLLFQPLENNKKSIVQSATEGKARQFGAILTGAILILVQLLVPATVAQIICISLLSVLCLFWIRSINKVTTSYKDYIGNSLDNLKIEQGLKTLPTNLISNYLETKSIGNYSLGSLLLPGSPIFSSKSANELPQKWPGIPNDTIAKKMDFIDDIASNWIDIHFNECLILLEDESVEVVSHLLLTLKQKFNSQEFKDHISSSKFEFTPRLLLLLVLVDYDFSLSKRNIEKTIGDHQYPTTTRLMLIDIVSKTYYATFESCFLSLIDGKSILSNDIFRCILEHKTIESESNYISIKNKIEEEVNHYNWLLCSIIDLRNEPTLKALVTLLEEELKKLELTIFQLSFILFNKNEILKIVNIIKNDIHDKKILAIELVDLIFDEGVKEYVLPIIDDLDFDDKHAKLNLFFPQTHTDPFDRLKQLLNLENRRLPVYLRIRVMDLISASKIGYVPMEVLANVFNSDLVIREAAFSCLLKISKEKFSYYVQRDNSKIAFLFNTSPFEYKDGWIGIYNLLNDFKSSLFFGSLSEENRMEMARICDQKVYRLKDLKMMPHGNFAFLLRPGSSATPMTNRSTTTLAIIEDLLIGDHLAFSKVASYFTEEASFVRLEHKALIEFIGTSPLCYQKIERALGN